MVLEPPDVGRLGHGSLSVYGEDLPLVGPVDEDRGLARDADEVGLEYREAEEHGGAGVYGVAAALEGVVAGLGGEVVGGGDHAVGAHDDGSGRE